MTKTASAKGSSAKLGSFTFVLHSHLPYVMSHGRWPHGMDWLSEAAAETYLPMLKVLERLAEKNIKPAGMTIALSPVLSEQLKHPGFEDEFTAYLDQKIKNAIADEEHYSKEGDSGSAEAAMVSLARHWKDFYEQTRKYFLEELGADILSGFRKYEEAGVIETMTCAATHGYLPLLGKDECVRAQLKLAALTHKKNFGKQPSGTWLPECAYRPAYKWAYPVEVPFGKEKERLGIENLVAEAGFNYTILDAHLIKGGKPIGVYIERFEALKKLWDRFEENVRPEASSPGSSHVPYFVASGEGDTGMSVFFRDSSTGVQVWSGEHGYPGDPWYLEFHKKHFPGGLRYWRVTSSNADLGQKKLYEPEKIEERVRENASHFVGIVRDLLKKHRDESGAAGILVAPYDAELFGHWWFEGPRWLEHVIEGLHEKGDVELVTCGQYLKDNPPDQVISLPEGSWGEGGFHYIWLNEMNNWTWKHIYDAENIFVKLATEHGTGAGGMLLRVLKQAARELLLMESSDWQFLISTQSARDYAEKRISQHYSDFTRLVEIVGKLLQSDGVVSKDDEAFLEEVEANDCLFEDIDINLWATK